MTLHQHIHRTGLKSVALRTVATAFALICLFGNSAFAAAPPANTAIGTQASAAYNDPNGASQTATSNVVTTRVTQVGSYLLDTNSVTTTTAVNSQYGAAGAIIATSHSLTNTGNGTDIFNLTVDSTASGFSKVEIYADDGTGKPAGAALCTSIPSVTCTASAPVSIASGGVYQFLVNYSIPSTATATSFGTGSLVVGTVTAKPVTTALYATTSISDSDNVRLTALAAFSVSQALAAPSVASSSATSNKAWPVSTSGQRSAASCSATPTMVDAITPTAGCVYTTVTVTIRNNGGATGLFSVQDTLPTGMTYVPGSAVWSNFPGVAQGDAAGGDSSGMDFQALASGSTTIVSAAIAAITANTTQTLSFIVRINNTAGIGTNTTTSTAMYDPKDAPSATAASPSTTTTATNSAIFTVMGTYGIVLGSGAGTATAVTSLDTASGVPNTSVNDKSIIAFGVSGATIKFPGTVFNIGNATDTVNLTVAIGSFPLGTTFSLYGSDGLTPLTAGNTGPIAPGASMNFYVAAALPTLSTTTSGPFNAVVTGTSTSDVTKTETTTDQLTTIIAVMVDLTNTSPGTGQGSLANGDLGAGPSPLPTTILPTPAGTGAVFTLFIKNNDASANSSSLAASQGNTFPGSLPAGWTVRFVASGGTCTSTAITTTGTIAANGGIVQVQACVTPPISQTPITAQNIYFQVSSTIATSNGVIATDIITDAVAVTAPATYMSTLIQNNTGQVSSGGSVTYTHTLTNTGAQSCSGPYTITAVPSAAGWATSIYIDANNNGIAEASELLTTGSVAGPLAPGASVKLLVRVFAAGGASVDAADLTTVTVTFPGGITGCGTDIVTDTSTVVVGQMRLQKFQAIDATCSGIIVPTLFTDLSAKPGQCITYQILATNQGSASVSGMLIHDGIPPYTTLMAGGSCAVSPNVTPSTLTYTGNASGVSCGTATNVPGGGTATLTYSVKVNQ